MYLYLRQLIEAIESNLAY